MKKGKKLWVLKRCAIVPDRSPVQTENEQANESAVSLFGGMFIKVLLPGETNIHKQQFNYLPLLRLRRVLRLQ
jgi:hypothetical protein